MIHHDSPWFTMIHHYSPLKNQDFPHEFLWTPQGTGSREEKKSVLAKLRDGSVQQAAMDHPYRIHTEYIRGC